MKIEEAERLQLTLTICFKMIYKSKHKLDKLIHLLDIQVAAIFQFVNLSNLTQNKLTTWLIKLNIVYKTSI